MLACHLDTVMLPLVVVVTILAASLIVKVLIFLHLAEVFLLAIRDPAVTHIVIDHSRVGTLRCRELFNLSVKGDTNHRDSTFAEETNKSVANPDIGSGKHHFEPSEPKQHIEKEDKQKKHNCDTHRQITADEEEASIKGSKLQVM